MPGPVEAAQAADQSHAHGNAEAAGGVVFPVEQSNGDPGKHERAHQQHQDRDGVERDADVARVPRSPVPAVRPVQVLNISSTPEIDSVLATMVSLSPS